MEKDGIYNEISTESEFNDLYRKYYESLFYYAYGFIPQEEACRDILADVFEQAWKKRTRLKKSTVSSFLYSCVRNGCIDHLRHTNASLHYIQLLESSDNDEHTASPQEREELYVRLQQAVDDLPERPRYVLYQCYFKHKKYKEVAATLDISVNAVKMHIMKALSILRKNFSVTES
jgi:RNA polymerase sigma-70 factor (family 1)